jgi:hypothetical protein
MGSGLAPKSLPARIKSGRRILAVLDKPHSAICRQMSKIALKLLDKHPPIQGTIVEKLMTPTAGGSIRSRRQASRTKWRQTCIACLTDLLAKMEGVFGSPSRILSPIDFSEFFVGPSRWSFITSSAIFSGKYNSTALFRMLKNAPWLILNPDMP